MSKKYAIYQENARSKTQKIICIFDTLTEAEKWLEENGYEPTRWDTYVTENDANLTCWIEITYAP